MEEVKMYKTNYIALVNAYSKDVDALELIETNMNNLNNYVSAVYAMEVQIQTLRFSLEGDEYREAVTNLDRRRRSAHEAAIAACSILNRLAGLEGVEPLYSGNLEDRNEVAEFCIAIVDELFHGRSRCTVKELLES